jgi:hypothetical protein
MDNAALKMVCSWLHHSLRFLQTDPATIVALMMVQCSLSVSATPGAKSRQEILQFGTAAKGFAITDELGRS